MTKPNNLVIVDDEDGGRTLSPGGKADKTDDLNPIDSTTGDTKFDDLDSRFNMPTPGVEGEEEEESEEELAALFPKKGKKAADEAGEEEESEEGEEEEEEPEPEVADEKDEGEEEEEEDPEPKTGRGFKGRLAREKRLREELAADVADLRARNDRLEQTINARASEEAFTTKRADLNTKIEAKRTELEAAAEAGNSKDQVRLIEELSDLKAELRSATQQYDAAKEAAEKRKTTVSPIVTRKVAQWKRKHQRFSSDAVFGNFAIAVDRQLAAEGYDPETDEYYAELDKRIGERYPEEYKGASKRSKHPSQNQRRDTDGVRRPAKKIGGEFEVDGKGRVKLTKDHVRIMRTFNLDPDDPADVREFVANNT